MILAISAGWWIGWGVGLVVVLIAATLLLVIIALARRIAGQADEITKALDGARANTDAMYGLTDTNMALDRIARGLCAARGGDAA